MYKNNLKPKSIEKIGDHLFISILTNLLLATNKIEIDVHTVGSK